MPRGNRNAGDTDGGDLRARQTKGDTRHREALFHAWVNVSIPKAESDEVDAFGRSPVYQDALEHLLATHHRVNIIYNLKEGCYQVNTFCMDEESPNAGLMVSQRSTDPFRALLKLVYAHAHLLPADYSGAVRGGDEDW